MKKFFPALEWLLRYDINNWKGDLAAGLTVAVMLIPQGMAYALLAGLPPIIGLYASVVPLLVYALFGTSRQLAVG
ncbi:MAG: sodium-independent anion transporter, partial [Calditrichaeota bacterium]|nr:sodium-independent anion transporter [Calditrichota bacterium]MCB0313516.1 sodium-independent anion transporter [Calditrichota bacterium]